MSDAALRRALQLRGQAVATAQRELAAAIADEQAATGALAACKAAIRNEIAAASRPEADDAAVEALGPWLRTARAAVARAETGWTAAAAATVRARAVLAAARGAEASVAALIETRAAEQAARSARAEQTGLAEAALRRHAQGSRDT